MRWAGHIECLYETSEGKRAFGRPTRRWEDNIKLYLKEIGSECVGWIGVAQNKFKCRAVVNMLMNIHV
jgi:hypothetical protein